MIVNKNVCKTFVGTKIGVRKNSESEWELPKLNGLVANRNDIRGILRWKYYLMASVTVDMKSIRLFAIIDHKYGPF